MSHKSLYAVATVVASLSFAVMLAKAPPVVQAFAVVAFAFALAVVVALLTYTPRLAIVGWESDVNPHSTPVLAESVPAGFQVEQAPPAVVVPEIDDAMIAAMMAIADQTAPVKRVRKASTPRKPATSRVAAKASKPTTVTPRKPRVRKSTPSA